MRWIRSWAGGSATAVRRAARDAAGYLSTTLRTDRQVRGFAVLVGSTLVLFLALGLWAELRGSEALSRYLDLSRDHSVAEVYGYALSASTAALLLGAWRRSGLVLYLALGLVFLFALADDALKYHESFARYVLVPALDPPSLPRMRRQDTGEVMAWMLAAVILAVPLLLSLRQRAEGKLTVLLIISLPIGLLCVCGIGGDMAHSWAQGRAANVVVGYAEDGGELSALALAAVLAFMFRRSPLGRPHAAGKVGGLADRPAPALPSIRGQSHEPLRRPARPADLHARPERQGPHPDGLLSRRSRP